MRSRILLLATVLASVLLPAPSASAADAAINVIGRDRNNGWWSEMATAADGNPMIASFNASNRSVEVRTCLNEDCTRVRTGVITSGFVFHDLDVAIGPDGLPVFAVTSVNVQFGGGSVAVVKCSDIHCEGAKATNRLWWGLDGGPGHVSIDVDADNEPTVIYTARGSWNSAYSTTLVSCGDPACTSTRRETRPLGLARSHDVAIGPDGLPVLALGPAAGQPRVTLERCTEPTCRERTSTPIGSANAGAPRLASNGKEITVVSVDEKSRIERVVCDIKECSRPETISDERVKAGLPNVAYVESGLSVVGYTDHTDDGLWISRCARSCDREQIVAGRAGWNGLAVGVASSDGVAYISFHESTGRRLAWAQIGVL